MAKAAHTERNGGGANNRLLMAAFRARMPTRRIQATSAYGMDPNWVEAMAFAWLAKQTLDAVPGNLPSVTGARRPVVLGAVYPGAYSATSSLVS